MRHHRSLRARGPRHYYQLVRWRVLEQPLWRWRKRQNPQEIDDRAFLALFGVDREPAGFVRRFKTEALRRLWLSPEARDECVAILRKIGTTDEVISEADRFCAHDVDLLGSGPTRLGPRIDWHADFKSGRRWPTEFFWDIDYINEGEPSDVKVAWELSRFHPAAWLGKSFWLTDDPRYALKFQELVTDWIDQNPYLYGINWVVGMEVAIRACNWMLGLGFFGAASIIPDRWWFRFLKTLYMHGEFLGNALEYGRRPNNHFIADGAGLVALGVLFVDTRPGRRWLQLGASILERELQQQVHPDGVHYEMSTSYHRLVLELCYAAYVLAAKNGVGFSAEFRERLERMFEVVAWYTKPDGTAPLLGDGDNGRLFRFSEREDFRDHRGALTVGTVLFGRSDLKQVSDGFREDALWLMGPDAWTRFEAVPDRVVELSGHGFPDGGFYVLRRRDCHVFVDAGEIGLAGWGGHGHNDTLSFELTVGPQTFVLDPGTYAYTGDPRAQVAFAATASHNTVRVDGQEIAEWKRMWRLDHDPTRPGVLDFRVEADEEILEVEHHGYARLPSPVIHRRTLRFFPGREEWLLEDFLYGTGRHTYELFLHLAPDVAVSREAAGRLVLAGRHARLSIECDGDMELSEGWVAPAYGVRVPAPVATIRKEGTVPARFRTVFRVMDRASVPSGAGGTRRP